MAKKLKKYSVSAAVVGSKYLGEFKAANKEAAKRMASESEAAGISFCHQCSENCEDPQVTEIFAEEIK